MKKYWYNILNFIAILIGAGIWVASFYKSHLNETLLNVVAFCGGLYVFYSIYLFLLNRVKFDWHLLKGNYIFKVLALVLYIPFVLTSLYNCFGQNNSPKTLVYEGNLYKPDTLFVPIKDSLAIDADNPFLALHHDIDIKNDTLIVTQSELPATIQNKQVDPSLFWGIYFHFIDPGNQHMTTTPNARLWAAIIGILGVFLLNGLLVSSIIGWIDTRKEKWLKGEVRYKCRLKFCPHYVIIGGNDMVLGIVKQLFEAIGNDRSLGIGKLFLPTYILIQTNRDVESFRRELFSDLTEDQQKRIIIYYGSRTSTEDIADLVLENAREVYILGEDTRTDDLESYHDTMNMECLKLVSEDIKDVTKYYCTEDEKGRVIEDYRLVCRVMFEYQTSFSVFQFSEISNDIKQRVRFKPFNYYEMWAQRVLISKEFKKSLKEFTSYIPLEGVGIDRESDNFVHLIIVGMSRAGVALAVEAAHLAHYPNFETKKKRTRITFIDMNMETEMNFFKGRFQSLFSVARHRYVSESTGSMYHDVKKYPWINPLKYSLCKSPYYGDYLGDDFIDIEWEFINGSVEHPNIQQYLVDASNNSDAKITIASCLSEDNKALAVALYLPRTVYLKDNVQQILVYQRYASSTINMVSNKRFSSAYDNKLKSFGMVSDGYDVSLVNDAEMIANLVSERYFAMHADIEKYTNGLIDRNYDPCEKRIAEEIKDKLLKHFELDSDYMKKNDLKVQKIVEYCEKYCEENKVRRIDKVPVAAWWSNIYNANILWTKLRCINFIDDGTINELSDIDIWDLANVEHNRWNMEQLLMTYSPLTKEEMFDVLHYHDKPLRNIYKGVMKHSDLCSCNQLKVYGKTFNYDVAFARDLVDNYYKVKENNKKN